jgi:hypothetical protein
MSNPGDQLNSDKWPTLAAFPLPAKALISVVILTMAFAMAGALGQIIVHDIIPTFFSDQVSEDKSIHTMEDMKPSKAVEEGEAVSGRGDLFSEAPAMGKSTESAPFYKSEQFVWTLKWTHIHLFGINMIFIFMGAITIFLNISMKARTWLVILPFIGVLLDIATMWLKAYVSPAFFWLHLPGGGLFGTAFAIVSLRAFWEMWRVRNDFAVTNNV